MFLACEEPRDLDKEVDLKLERKRSKYITKETQKCFDKATSEAEVYVDSLIAQWVSEQLVDTMVIPEKPMRPITPEHILGTIDTFSNK